MLETEQPLDHSYRSRLNLSRHPGRYDFQPNESSSQNQFDHDALLTDFNEYQSQQTNPDQAALKHLFSPQDDQAVTNEPDYNELDPSNPAIFLPSSSSDIDLGHKEDQSFDYYFNLNQSSDHSPSRTSIDLPEQDLSLESLGTLENPDPHLATQPSLAAQASRRSSPLSDSPSRFATEQIELIKSWQSRNLYSSTKNIDLLTIATGLNASQIGRCIAKHRRRKLEPYLSPATAQEHVPHHLQLETANSSLHVALKSLIASSRAPIINIAIAGRVIHTNPTLTPLLVA